MFISTVKNCKMAVILASDSLILKYTVLHGVLSMTFYPFILELLTPLRKEGEHEESIVTLIYFFFKGNEQVM